MKKGSGNNEKIEHLRNEYEKKLESMQNKVHELEDELNVQWLLMGVFNVIIVHSIGEQERRARPTN